MHDCIGVGMDDCMGMVMRVYTCGHLIMPRYRATLTILVTIYTHKCRMTL